MSALCQPAGPAISSASAEAALLVCCGRPGEHSVAASEIRSLVRQITDWASLIRAADFHGMLPLLYWRLHASCPEAVPGEALSRLRDEFNANTRHNLLLTGELCDLLDLFESNGIPAIPFKGPVLACWLYGNLALRQFVDLDILVPPRHVSRARELLVQRGYRTYPVLTPTQEQAFLRSTYDYSFLREGGEDLVELHWAVAPRQFCFPLNYDRLWDRLQSIPLGGKQVRTLSPEDLLLILCVHGTRHLWEALGWICDIARLAHATDRMNWQEVMRQARALA